MKKAFCILFAVFLCVSALLCSCGLREASDSSDTSALFPEEKAYVPHLGKTDKYVGKTLRILASAGDTKDSFHTFAKEALDPDATNGEIVNDAFYERNKALEEEYGFTTETTWSAAWTVFEESARDAYASSTPYDVYITGASTFASLVTDGIFADLNSLQGSHLSLDSEWWDPLSNQALSIANKLYFAVSDITLLDKQNTRCVVYNLDILKESNLPDPASSAVNGTWTLDDFYTLARTAAKEDGDGVTEFYGDDIWGGALAAFDVYTLIAGCNCPIVTKNEQDIPALAIENERNTAAFSDIFENAVSDEKAFAYTPKYNSDFMCDDILASEIFLRGNVLLYINTVDFITDDMKNSDINYGILPLPKMDETQKNYACGINPYWFSCVAIGKNCTDTDFATFALEAMAWSASEYVIPEYYNYLMADRTVDGVNTQQVLDTVFRNRLADIAIIYNWDDCLQYYSGGKFYFSTENFAPQMNITLEFFLNEE